MTPHAVGPRSWGSYEWHRVHADTVEDVGPEGLGDAAQPGRKPTPARDLKRRYGPAKREHPHLRAGISGRDCLAVSPHAVDRISRRRVPLGDHDHAH
jgi:hypothetical protein